MRTTNSTATFQQAFVLNADCGELPAGSYAIEIDEDEIPAVGRTAYRRTAVCFYVEDRGSTRTLLVDPSDLETALRRDSEIGSGSLKRECGPAIPGQARLP